MSIKKITSVVLCLLFVLLLSACGNKKTSSNDYLSIFNDKENTHIRIGMTKSEVTNQLGDPKESYDTADRYDGIELLYRNDLLMGYWIPGGNGPKSNYQAGKGAMIGAKKSDVESTFGKGFSADFNSVNYWYNMNTMKLLETAEEFDSCNKEDLFCYSFLYDKNDIVTSISAGDYNWTTKME